MIVKAASNTCNLCHRRSSCFSSLDDEELDKLNQSRVELLFKPNETICKQGAFASQISFVQKGLVKIYLETDHEQNLIVNIIPPGKLIGLPSLYNEKLCLYTAVAVEESVICSININLFYGYIRSNGEFASKLIHEMNVNTSLGYQRMLSLTQKQVHGRIADSILYLAEHVYDSDSFNFSLTRSDLAEFSNTSNESVTRVLTKFKNEKIIQIQNGILDIINKERLQQIQQFG